MSTAHERLEDVNRSVADLERKLRILTEEEAHFPHNQQVRDAIRETNDALSRLYLKRFHHRNAISPMPRAKYLPIAHPSHRHKNVHQVRGPHQIEYDRTKPLPPASLNQMAILRINEAREGNKYIDKLEKLSQLPFHLQTPVSTPPLRTRPIRKQVLKRVPQLKPIPQGPNYGAHQPLSMPATVYTSVPADTAVVTSTTPVGSGSKKDRRLETPTNRDPLGVTDIEELKQMAHKLQIPGFNVFSRDRLPKRLGPVNSFIVNLDSANDPRNGTHWVCMYSGPKQAETIYFDPFGSSAPEEVVKLMRTSKKKCIGSTTQAQDVRKSDCGYWCLWALDHLSKGVPIGNMLAKLDPLDPVKNEKMLHRFFLK